MNIDSIYTSPDKDELEFHKKEERKSNEKDIRKENVLKKVN